MNPSGSGWVASIKRLYDVYWQSLHARGTFNERLSALEGATGWGQGAHAG